MLSKDRDGNIFDLQDQGTKAFTIVFWAAITSFFALKNSICLILCIRVSPSDANRMSALPEVKKKHPKDNFRANISHKAGLFKESYSTSTYSKAKNLLWQLWLAEIIVGAFFMDS